ncbi:enolase 4 isoform X5 [Ictalurus furcatus]|nr:enolase 4 isoform X5 [Ictalurus furcatus]
MSKTLPCMSLDWGRKPEYPEETPIARGEHANSTHTEQRWESKPRPWRCEANVLTTKPPCALRAPSHNLEMPISLQCMSLDWGRKPEYPEVTPVTWGEHANSVHIGRRWDSNPLPRRCEANANYFSSFSHTPVISAVVGREVYDGRGEAALQVDVYCVVRNEEKLVSNAVVTSMESDVMEIWNVAPNGNHPQASVSVALEWIRDQLSSMLHGFNPTHQTYLDKLLSDYYMARYLEDQESHNIEKQGEEEEKSETTTDTATACAPASSKDMKKGDKGKKGSATEKPLPPPEKPEPMLPGAMVVGALSMAAAKSAASLAAIPLYKHILTLRDLQALRVFMPMPLVSVLSCGKASTGKLNLLEEVILLPTVPYRTRECVTLKAESTAIQRNKIIDMCRDVQREIRRIAVTTAGKSGPALEGVSEGGAIQLGLERAEQALDLLTEACSNLGLPMGTELRLVINCAAHRLVDYSRGKYEVMAGTMKSPDELVDMFVGLINKYPAIGALIDPFRKEDVEQWQQLNSLIGQSCCLIADAAYRPCPRWKEAKPLPPGVTWITLRHRSDMTLTDLLHAVTERTEGETILAVSNEEIGDDSTIDVAVGTGVSFIKLGGPTGGWRMNKYNRLHRIEQELEEQGILGLSAASRVSFCPVLLYILEGRPVLGDVAVVLHFLHLLMMAFLVFHENPTDTAGLYLGLIRIISLMRAVWQFHSEHCHIPNYKMAWTRIQPGY